MTSRPPLIADAITRAFSGRAVVDAASLTLEPGEVTALIGPSGSGKTTLLRILAGMEHPDSGEIRTGNKVLSGAGQFVPVEKRRIGLVFQDFALFPHLSVIGNVMFGLQSMAKPERIKRAEEWLEKLGLSHRRNAFPHHLSGGEQQRTAIARALAPEPVAILLDEPFSGLDPALREQVRQAALEAVRNADIPALLVTHDASEALVHADKIAVIHSGQILQAGSPDDIYQRPSSLRVARALGPVHSVQRKDLPPDLLAQVNATADTLWYRPEAVQSGVGATLEIARAQLAGPVSELVLKLSDHASLFSACQPGRAVQVGDKLTISLNPDLVFDFAEETI